jgi:capsular exopolysaccharide synthesis family protein
MRDTPQSRNGEPLNAQQRRIEELRRGIRDLRQSVSQMRDNGAAYEPAEPIGPADAEADERPEAGQAPRLIRGGGAGRTRETRDEAAAAIGAAESNLTTFQRALERLGRQPQAPAAVGGGLGGSTLELVTYWKIIRKRLWLILLLMVIGGAGTGYYASQTPPRYTTSTTLYLNPAIANMSYSYSAIDSLQSLASTYSEFMRTRAFADRVAAELQGAVSSGQVLGSLSTQYVENTQFFRISATTGDPQSAQQLANAAAKVLIAQNIARQQAEAEQRKAQAVPDAERAKLVEARDTLQQQIEVYNGYIANLQAQLDQLKTAPKTEDNAKQLLDTQQQMLNYQSLRQTALTGLADTQAAITTTSDSGQTSLDTAVVVDQAPLPGGPLPVNITQQILIAILAAMTMGAALAFLLEYTDYTIKTPEAMESIYNMPVQGVIGKAPKQGSGRSPGELVTVLNTRSPIAESFRALRTGVHVAGLSSPLRKLMVTSARPSEGKTFVTANLAISLAQTGLKVILVDADLRKPSQHYLFDLPLAPGFTDLVINPSMLIEEALQPTAVETLKVLTCGIIPPNPAELIGSRRAAEMMEQLAQHADLVIFDTPPAATVTDALVIAPRVDAVLQVVLSGQTRVDVVRRCKTLLERNGARLLGPVLNQVPRVDMTSYEYYYSSGYYDSRDDRGGKGRGKRRSLKQSTVPLLASEAAHSNGNGNGNGHGAD